MFRSIGFGLATLTLITAIGCGDDGAGFGGGAGFGDGTGGSPSGEGGSGGASEGLGGSGGAGGEEAPGLEPYPDFCEFEYDADGNGRIDRRERNRFDEDWNLIQDLEDVDGDGDWDRSGWNTWMDGRLALQGLDNNGDGLNDSLTRYEWDEEGRILSLRQERGTGLFVYVARYSYSSDGLSGRVETDQDANGTVDRIKELTWDEDGNMTSEIEDGDNDGDSDIVITQSWDEHGKLALKLTDYNDDGIDLREEWVRDAQGRLLRHEEMDGLGNLHERETYLYDDEARTTTLSDDTNGDGRIDHRSIWTRNEESQIVRTERDFNADGIVDFISYNTYDEFGNRVGIDLDNSADGTVDSVETWTFNERGNYTSREIDHGVDGIIDSASTYNYDCFAE